MLCQVEFAAKGQDKHLIYPMHIPSSHQYLV